MRHPFYFYIPEGLAPQSILLPGGGQLMGNPSDKNYTH